MNNFTNPLHPYTLPSRSQSPPHEAKLVNKYGAPTHRQKKCSKIERKMIENRNGQLVTKAIRNAGKVLNMNIIAIYKISSKLKVWSFKIPHYA